MENKCDADFQSLTDNIGVFDPEDKQVLIPEMNRAGAHLLAGTCRSFGIRAPANND